MAESKKETKKIKDLSKLSPEEAALQLVQTRWAALTHDMTARKSDYVSNKNFFLAKADEMYDEEERSGQDRRPVPYSSMITLYYRDLIASRSPEFRAMPPALSQGAVVEEEKTRLDELASDIADSSEKVVRLTWGMSDMDLKFPDAALEGGILGDAFLRLLWDPDDKRGGKSGTPILDFLPPQRVRVGWASNNWREIEYFVTSERMSLTTIKDRYDVDVGSDRADMETAGKLSGWSSTPSGAKDYPTGDEAEIEGEKTEIPMSTVYRYWDKERYIIIIGMEKVVRNVEHGYGFCPIFHIPNIRVPNEPFGYPDHYWVTGIQRALNVLHDKARGIIKYQAGPIVLDIGNSLKGKQLPAGNNVVVPIPIGNEMRYLQWAGNLYPVLNQIEEEKKALFDIQGLPAELSATSGFMVQVQMVKALMRAETKKKNWEAAFRWMCKGILQLVRKFDKAAKLPAGVENLQWKIKWPEVLPQDEARVYQNLAIAKKLDIMSDYTAIEKTGNESPSDEMRRIEKENLKKAEMEAQIQAMLQGALGVEGQPAGGPPTPPVPAPPTGGELLQNIPKRLEEETRELPGAAERIAPTSLIGA